MQNVLLFFVVFGLTSGSTLVAGQAQSINTGASSGSYYRTFCPPLEKYLNKLRLAYKCRTSKGTSDNMDRSVRSPREIGYGQLDVFALRIEDIDWPKVYQIIRIDDFYECVFAVTKNPKIDSYNDLAAYAPNIRFVLPPRGPDTVNTFQFLQELDPNGLGGAKQIKIAKSLDAAIRDALKTSTDVVIFVRYPDPANPIFKLIAKLEGRFISVVDRQILTAKVANERVYQPKEVEVGRGGRTRNSKKLITACTPMVIFTGASSRISDWTLRERHKGTVQAIARLKLKDLLPKESPLSKLWQRMRDAPAIAIDKFLTRRNRN